MAQEICQVPFKFVSLIYYFTYAGGPHSYDRRVDRCAERGGGTPQARHRIAWFSWLQYYKLITCQSIVKVFRHDVSGGQPFWSVPTQNLRACRTPQLKLIHLYSFMSVYTLLDVPIKRSLLNYPAIEMRSLNSQPPALTVPHSLCIDLKQKQRDERREKYIYI